MSRVVLFEDAAFATLLPTVYWRTVFELRCGRRSLFGAAERALPDAIGGLWTRAWIAKVAAERFDLPINQPVRGGDVLINGRLILDKSIGIAPGPFVAHTENGIAYVSCDEALAKRLGPEDFLDRSRWSNLIASCPNAAMRGRMITYPWELIEHNIELLESDWEAQDALIEGEVDRAASLLNPQCIRIERGARIMPTAVIDATDGPVVLESGVTVRPQAYIQGPSHVAGDSLIHAHAYIHGGTSIGRVCKIGGEVDACIFEDYSNKSHHGFLGHSHVGSWVNLGAGTTNSDLKNTYGTVRVPIAGQEVDTGMIFFGAIIGDHVKTGIQQTLPSGTVIGFSSNVVCGGLVPRFVRSFTWLTDRGPEEGDVVRLIKTAAIAMQRRERVLTDAERALFGKLPEIVAYFEPEPTRWRPPVEPVAMIPKPMPMPQYD